MVAHVPGQIIPRPPCFPSPWQTFGQGDILSHLLCVLQCLRPRIESHVLGMPEVISVDRRSTSDSRRRYPAQSVGCTSYGYRYYPGFSHEFVRDILDEWPESDLILDPWNGSGATTTVAAELGRQCVGIDLNPAMVVIARAALLTDADTAKIRRQARGLEATQEREFVAQRRRSSV